VNALLVHAECEGGQVEHGGGDAEGAGSADQVTEDLFHFGAAPGLQVPVQRGCCRGLASSAGAPW